jgi:hypothetical protein
MLDLLRGNDEFKSNDTAGRHLEETYSKDGLKGSTYFCQQSGAVWVSASVDHQAICQRVLGQDSGTSSLSSYLRWDDVSAVDLVELLYAIETA